MKIHANLCLIFVYLSFVFTPAIAQTTDSNFNDASSWSINSSSNLRNNFAFDENAATRWTTRTRQTENQFFEIDFNTVKAFDRIVLDSTRSPEDYPREYEVLVSQDGEIWESVVQGVPEKADQIVIDFNQQNTRFLRIEQNGSDSFYWWSIHELMISLENTNVTQEPPLQEPPADDVVNAIRFLNQATFGTTQNELQELLSLDNDIDTAFEKWIDQQFSMRATDNIFDTQLAEFPADSNFVRNNDTFVDQWFINAVEAPDQLRQRVAWALSQIFVVSVRGAGLHRRPFGVGDYYDLLIRDGLGNYRELLEKITLHPTMGQYLSMAGNQRANPEFAISPDENYAREVMQLFSVGLVQLNIDGTPITQLSSNGVDQIPVATYDMATIEGFARVFTGWNYQCDDSNPRRCEFDRLRVTESPPSRTFNQVAPLIMYPEQHEPGTKELLQYPGAVSSLAANQSGELDMEMALDNIFNHPNVGPFISKQLIRKLVASNPSPAYVARVARVFNNDGTGTRGNLAAVVKAILTDNEARAGISPANIETFGKTREPIMRIIHLWRNYNVYAGTDRIDASTSFRGGRFSPSDEIEQGPLQARSVFNFYSPSFAPTGEIQEKNLVAPELKLANEFLNTTLTNFFYNQIFRFTSADSQRRDGRAFINIDQEVELAEDLATEEIVDLVAVKLFGREDLISSTLRDHVVREVDLINSRNDRDFENRASTAIFLISTSPEFAWQQ